MPKAKSVIITPRTSASDFSSKALDDLRWLNREAAAEVRRLAISNLSSVAGGLAPKRRLNPPARPLVDVDSFPDIYSLCLEGDCLEPLIPDGAAVVIKKSEPYTVGDIVCIWWRPEFVKPGFYQGWLKRVAMAAPPWVKQYPYNDHPESDVSAVMLMEQLNPAGRYTVPCNRIHAIHKAVAYGPAAKIGGSVRPDELMPIGGGKVPKPV